MLVKKGQPDDGKAAQNHSWTPVLLLMCSRSSNELAEEPKLEACIPSTLLSWYRLDFPEHVLSSS